MHGVRVHDVFFKRTSFWCCWNIINFPFKENTSSNHQLSKSLSFFPSAWDIRAGFTIQCHLSPGVCQQCKSELAITERSPIRSAVDMFSSISKIRGISKRQLVSLAWKVFFWQTRQTHNVFFQHTALKESKNLWIHQWSWLSLQKIVFRCNPDHSRKSSIRCLCREVLSLVLYI